MVLSLIFLALWVLLNPAPGVLLVLLSTGFHLNAWIGLFNMIPAGPFDGAKVLNWSVPVFGVTVLVGVVLALLFNDTRVYMLINWLH